MAHVTVVGGGVIGLLAARDLRAAGLEAVYGNDGGDAWCTVRNPLRFFSHRRDGISGPTGRFAAAVWRD